MFSWRFLVGFFFEVKIEERHRTRVAVCSLNVPLVEDEIVLMEKLRGLSRFRNQFLSLCDMVYDYLAHIGNQLFSVEL